LHSPSLPVTIFPKARKIPSATSISGNWTASYVYRKNGKMVTQTINSDSEPFYLDWDENSNMTTGITAGLVYYAKIVGCLYYF
jgi:hypothetical protein